MRRWHARLWKPALSILIALHLIAVVAWILPLPPCALRGRLLGIEAPYMLATGSWQNWNMFAPDPPRINFDLEARIIYADGSSEVWDFPRMQDLGLFQKSLQERFRKWREQMRLNGNRALRGDAARWIALHHRTRRPVAIEFRRLWSQIPAPQPGDYQPMPQEYEPVRAARFFRYQVQAKDLQ
ncbi:MAG: hypothetical protein ACYCW6_04095 [Candidatus Xenobia bacterium]